MSHSDFPPAADLQSRLEMSSLVSDGKFDFERFRSMPLPSESQILEGWGGRAGRPLVSVLCLTYNHRQFIEDSLRGFLLQKTSFPFEVIVHDDASTDGTSEVVAAWQVRYPGIIRHVRQATNLFSKGASPSALAVEYANGQFICICEGDDFWIDENKLAIQAQSLISESDVAVSYHNAVVIDAQGTVVKLSQLRPELQIDRSAEDLMLAEAWILNLTRMIRRSAFEFPPEFFKTANRDRFQISVIGSHGRAKYETVAQPAVYRVHSGGIWSQLDRRAKTEERISTAFWLARYYHRAKKPQLARKFETDFLKYVTRRYSIFRILQAMFLRLRILRRR